MEVPRVPTPLSLDEAAAVMCSTYLELYGVLPDPRIAAFALANVWLENDQGNAIIQYNWGNIMATSASQMHWVPPWVRNPEHRLHDEWQRGEIPGMFRAYDSHEVGARAKWSLLARRYRPALELAGVGDFDAAYRELVALGYCPDCAPNINRIAENVTTFAERFLSDGLFERVCGAALPVAERIRRGELTQAEFDEMRAQGFENVGPALTAIEATLAAPACAAIHTAGRGEWLAAVATLAIPGAVLGLERLASSRPNAYRTVGAMAVGMAAAGVATVIAPKMKPKAAA